MKKFNFTVLLLLAISFSISGKQKEGSEFNEISNFDKDNVRKSDTIEFFQDEFSEEKDYNLYAYVEKQYELNRANKFKTKKYDFFKEYLNVKGEIEKIEYFSGDEVWATLNFIKVDDRIFYNVKGSYENVELYREIDCGLIITGRLPDEETINWDAHFLNSNGQIEYEEYGDEENYIGRSIFLYNQNNNLKSVYNYFFNYENLNPELEYLKKEPNNDSLMQLSSVETFKYDDSGKLLSIEMFIYEHIETKIFNIEYNERGHMINDYFKGKVEYEYYDETEYKRPGNEKKR